MKNELKNFAFFGTSSFSVEVLDTLNSSKVTPDLVVTTPDRPSGRGLKLNPSPVKKWAEEKKIPIFQPQGFKDEENVIKLKEMAPDQEKGWELFVVASYGLILPASVIYMPRYKSINIHPSLLPKLRGATPIQGAILHENETGVSLIRMDEKMDHGPILTQKKVPYQDWPIDAPTLEKDLAIEGAELLIETIPRWIKQEITEEPQNEKEATYTEVINKKDAFLDMENERAEDLLRKVKAYKEKPKPYFFKELEIGTKKRVIVTEASLQNNEFVIEKVIPEGGKEISYQEFLQRKR
ncbi:MAG: methionyl-tRNA formyltransferase [Candidatus Paceibacterota bacterium]